MAFQPVSWCFEWDLETAKMGLNSSRTPCFNETHGKSRRTPFCVQSTHFEHWACRVHAHSASGIGLYFYCLRAVCSWLLGQPQPVPPQPCVVVVNLGGLPIVGCLLGQVTQGSHRAHVWCNVSWQFHEWDLMTGNRQGDGNPSKCDRNPSPRRFLVCLTFS